MKLKNNLLKTQATKPISSTNEGSKSGKTFERFKKFKMYSASPASTPKSSQISSNEILNLKGVQVQEKQSNIEENASSISLFANSLSHSYNSFYEFKKLMQVQ